MNKTLVIAFCAGLVSSVVGASAGLILSSPYTEDRRELVFGYDSLESTLVRTYACFCKTEVRGDKLQGYAKGNKTAFEASGSTLRGVLFPVSATELKRIDAFKNVPEDYYRKRVTVGKLPAWIYIKK